MGDIQMLIEAAREQTASAVDSALAKEAYRWSKGQALYAAGVPFPPVRYGNKTLVPGQGNNLYVFPAVGLAIVATRAQRVTDEMFVVFA